jgi:hypothetical protein
VATELLVGPVYFRLVFGGKLDDEFANTIVDNVMRGYATNKGQAAAQPPLNRRSTAQ